MPRGQQGSSRRAAEPDSGWEIPVHMERGYHCKRPSSMPSAGQGPPQRQAALPRTLVALRPEHPCSSVMSPWLIPHSDPGRRASCPLPTPTLCSATARSSSERVNARSSSPLAIAPSFTWRGTTASPVPAAGYARSGLPAPHAHGTLVTAPGAPVEAK